jgi:hypothetical protein
MASEQVDLTAFAPLENCCYVREATMNGQLGWVLIDSEGECELFSEIRGDVFFYAAERELTVVQPN